MASRFSFLVTICDWNFVCSGAGSKNLSEVNTIPVEKLESVGQIKLARSKTERQRHNNILAEEAAQIFDDKISVEQKVNFTLGCLKPLFFLHGSFIGIFEMCR